MNTKIEFNKTNNNKRLVYYETNQKEGVNEK